MGRAGTTRTDGHNVSRDEAGTYTSRSSATLAAGVKPLPAGGIFKSAAVEVLQRQRRLMTTGEICRLALDWGLLRCSGKTPEATMASSLYGDIKRKDKLSLFVRPQEGMFGLREWVQEGLLPPLPSNSSLMATTKRGGQRPGRAVGLGSKRSRSMEASPSTRTGGGTVIDDTEEVGGVDDDDNYEDGRNNKFAAGGGGRVYNDRKEGRTATPSLTNSYAKPPITTTTTIIKLPFNTDHSHQQQQFMAPPQSAPPPNNLNTAAIAPPSLFTAVAGETNNRGTSFTGDVTNKMLQSNTAPEDGRLIESSPLVMASFNTMLHSDNNSNNTAATTTNISQYHHQQITPLHLDMHRTAVEHGNHHQYQQQHNGGGSNLAMDHHMFGGHFQAHHNFEMPLVPSSVFGVDRTDYDSVFNGSGLFFSSPGLEAPPPLTSNNFNGTGTGTSPFLGIFLDNACRTHPQSGGQYGSTNITTNVSPQLDQTQAQRQLQQQEQKKEIQEIIMWDSTTRDTITAATAAAATAAAAHSRGKDKHNSPSPEGSISPACDGNNLLSPSEEPIEGHHPIYNGSGNGNNNGQAGCLHKPCDTGGLVVEKSIALKAVDAHGGDCDGQQQQQQYSDTPINPHHNHSDQSLIEKIHQIEKKVSGVEERWGSMHLNAGKAHLLMYHACQHPALAAHCEARGREALERSYTIMAYNGGRKAVEQVEKDIAAGGIH